MSISIKDGVDVMGLRPEIILAITVADGVLSDHDFDLVITSARDGRHSEKSLHYAGAAIDIRSRHLDDVTAIALEIQRRLGKHFDVVVERDHIHIEYQPRYSA